MDRYRRRRPTRQGFTLMEVLLVLVILVILGSMATMFIRGAQRKARADAARSQIGIFDNAVKMYELNALSYPQTAEGLAVLRTPPADATASSWAGPYLDRDVPPDPWGNAYQYELLDPDNFRIWSMGPDGISNTDDDIDNQM